MSEKQFRRQFSQKLSNQFLFTQIESHGASPGIPDTHFLVKRSNNTGFIEFKYMAKRASRIDLRKTQVIWIPRYVRNGGKCFIAAKVAKKAIYIWPGKFAKELHKGENIWEIENKHFAIGKVDWDEIAYLLKTGNFNE